MNCSTAESYVVVSHFHCLVGSATVTEWHLLVCWTEFNVNTNSADLDQTAPLGAVRSGSALFVIKYFSNTIRVSEDSKMSML